MGGVDHFPTITFEFGIVKLSRSDFVFPLEEEGRRKEGRKKNNPHLALTRV